MGMGENKRLAEWAEERRAEARGGTEGPSAAFYDLDADGTPIEVKTTAETVQNPSGSRTGRYQIGEQNHRRLLDAGGEYDFVLRDGDDEITDVVTMTAAEFDELVTERGRKWPANSKLKIRHTVIHG